MNRHDAAVVAVSVLASVGTVLLLRERLRGPKGDTGPPGPMGISEWQPINPQDEATRSYVEWNWDR